MTLQLVLSLLGIGLGAGVLSGMFGIGGGVVIVPALMLVTRLTPHAATGTSLGALLLPVGALGAWAYWKSGNLDIRMSLLVAVGLVFGAWLGARLALQLEPALLKRLFAAFLMVVAFRIFWSA
jgi:uncharacterized protein